MNKTLTKITAVPALLLLSATQTFAAEGSFISGSLSVLRVGDGGISSIGRLISSIFNVAIIVAAIFVFFMLILGGYGWLTAGGDKAKVEEARTRITNALIGLAIVASAWALITIITQFFGVDITNLRLPSATGSNVGSGAGNVGL